VATILRDEPLTPGTTYHYAAFSYDEIPNYSTGVAGSATTSGTVVSAPAVATPDVGRTSFRHRGPNPFRDQTEFQFELPRAVVVSIEIFDASGRHVATVIRGERKAGSHRVDWSGRGTNGMRVAAGVYFARFRAPGLTATEKILVLR
jgi:hypothetical protein